MPRVNRVEKSRKSPGACGRCGTNLPPGSAYLWWKFRYGCRHVRCTAPACRPRQSELTQSATLSTIYAAQEELEATAVEIGKKIAAGKLKEALEDLKMAAETLFDVAEEVGGDCREAADAWENGNTQLEERADDATAWQDEVGDVWYTIDSVETADAPRLEELLEELVDVAGSCEL